MNTVLDFRKGKQTLPSRDPRLPDDKRLRRILILSALFFASGIFFFVARIQSQHANDAAPLPLKEAVAPASDHPYAQLSKFPDPTTYTSFQYRADLGTTTAKGTCTDTHVALLIFKSGDDYRVDPRAALYNVGFPCTKGTKYSIDIPLTDLHLIEGTKYYLIHAPQDTGAWYNPY